MSYDGGQRFDVHAVFQCHGGEGMAEIMKPHPLAVCAFQYLLKPMIDRRRVTQSRHTFRVEKIPPIGVGFDHAEKFLKLTVVQHLFVGIIWLRHRCAVCGIAHDEPFLHRRVECLMEHHMNAANHAVGKRFAFIILPFVSFFSNCKDTTGSSEYLKCAHAKTLAGAGGGHRLYGQVCPRNMHSCRDTDRSAYFEYFMTST